MSDEASNQAESKNEENNPYAYLKRDFSSENFKIEVKNLPKYYGIHEFRKLLNEKLKLASNKIKLPRKNSPFIFVCFRSDDDRLNAISTINDYKWKGKSLIAIKAKAAPDPLVKKRKGDDVNDPSKKKGKIDERPVAERLKDSTIPYWNIEYAEQLEKKQNEIKKVLAKLGTDLSRQNPNLQKWIEKQKAKFDGLPCELLPIRYSDKTEGYRNKCEFSIGIDEETNLPTVGFRVGSYVNGITGVGPIDELRHIPEPMKKAVKCYQDFVRSSELQVYSPEKQTGHFRQIMMRSAPDQLMLVFGMHPQDLDKEKIDRFKKDIVEYFQDGSGKECGVTSMYYEEITKRSSGEPQPLEHLAGDTHVTDTLLGLKFRVSPRAFFQVNAAAAELLYRTAIELARADAGPAAPTTVVDVCCGAGTIALCFARHGCDQALGLELVPEAIEDARRNAEANGLVGDGVEFFAGKAEEILGSVCHRARNADVVGVVDPPRAGLHQKAIVQLRKVRNLKRLVYMSCNPHAASKNFVDLGRPMSKTLQEECFVPIKAVAVDMFPHTTHCELVVYFERWDIVSDKE